MLAAGRGAAAPLMSEIVLRLVAILWGLGQHRPNVDGCSIDVCRL